MYSEAKKRLQVLIAQLLLDSVQRKRAEQGVNKLSDKRAEKLCDKLSRSLAELPKAAQELSDALDQELKADEDELDRLAIERMEDEGS